MSPFPHPSQARSDGLLAVGGELTSDWLLTAYAEGIFPWFDDDDGPVMWWSPDPRAVIPPGAMRITRSLRKRIRSERFTVRMDTDFEAVIRGCAQSRRETWITERMIAAYLALHDQGYAHCVATYAAPEDGSAGETLVGGLYGLSLGKMFFGESMFAHATDASKVAFAALHAQLQRWGFTLIDCQLPNDHLDSLGVGCIERNTFLRELEANRQHRSKIGRWALDADWPEALLPETAA